MLVLICKVKICFCFINVKRKGYDNYGKQKIQKQFETLINSKEVKDGIKEKYEERINEKMLTTAVTNGASTLDTSIEDIEFNFELEPNVSIDAMIEKYLKRYKEVEVNKIVKFLIDNVQLFVLKSEVIFKRYKTSMYDITYSREKISPNSKLPLHELTKKNVKLIKKLVKILSEKSDDDIGSYVFKAVRPFVKTEQKLEKLGFDLGNTEENKSYNLIFDIDTEDFANKLIDKINHKYRYPNAHVNNFEHLATHHIFHEIKPIDVKINKYKDKSKIPTESEIEEFKETFTFNFDNMQPCRYKYMKLIDDVPKDIKDAQILKLIKYHFPSIDKERLKTLIPYVEKRFITADILPPTDESKIMEVAHEMFDKYKVKAPFDADGLIYQEKTEIFSELIRQHKLFDLDKNNDDTFTIDLSIEEFKKSQFIKYVLDTLVYKKEVAI